MLNYDNDMYTRNWEKKCNLTTLLAYTNYTIEVYSFNGLSDSKNSLSGILQITTNEQGLPFYTHIVLSNVARTIIGEGIFIYVPY